MTTQTGFKQDQTGSYIAKDPGATLIYSIDWGPWMANSGATISNSTFAVSTVPYTAANVTKVSNGISGNITFVELSGGVAGNIYTVTNTVTSNTGSIDVRRFRLKVEPRYL
jgi:hypothetical protein